jgi:hypothetical protein
MLLAISLFSLVFGGLEYFGYGAMLERHLNGIRVRSMQIALRNGEIDPRITSVILKVATLAMMLFMLAVVITTAVALPTLLIFGKETASNLLSGKGVAFTLGGAVFGSMGFLLALGVVYVAWCAFIDMLWKGLEFAHKSRRGIVSTVSFSVSVLSFVLDRLFA